MTLKPHVPGQAGSLLELALLGPVPLGRLQGIVHQFRGTGV